MADAQRLGGLVPECHPQRQRQRQRQWQWHRIVAPVRTNGITSLHDAYSLGRGVNRMSTQFALSHAVRRLPEVVDICFSSTLCSLDHRPCTSASPPPPHGKTCKPDPHTVPAPLHDYSDGVVGLCTLHFALAEYL